MKKLFIIMATAFVAASCSSAKLINTSSHETYNDPELFVTAVFADLEISKEKITYFYIAPKTVSKCGLKNVIDSAVSEALIQNNNADVLIGLQKQVKYNSKGEIESVVITGYPARYVNMRGAGEDYFMDVKYSGGTSSDGDPAALAGNFLKFGK